MSQTHINYNDKYYRELRFSGTGILNTRHSVSLSKKKDQYLSTENTLRLRAEGVNSGNIIELQVKILNESTWTTLGTLTGTETKTFDIRSWDQFRFEVTTFDAPGEATLHVSGFVATLNQDIDAADCVRICDSNGNEIILDLIDGSYAVPTVEAKTPCVPTITNETIAIANTIYSYTFTDGTKRFLIQHRDNGELEFAFENTLGSYITLPKGSTYTEEDMNLQGVTIYFRSDKVGTLEILEWS